MQKKGAWPAIRVARSRRIAFGVALGIAVGCGDSADTTAGAGGMGGMGAAGAGGGGAPPGDGGNPRDGRGPTPPSAQGSVSLHLSESANGSALCSPGRQWVNAPSTPVPIQTQQTSGTEIGMRAVDGVGGSRVVCTVQKSGDKFTFSADITTRRSDGTTVLHPTVLHFDATGIAESGPAVDGNLTVMTDTTLANFVGEKCLFSVPPQGGVDSGKIWASVTCEMLADPTSPGDGCQIDVGFLVFENCAQ